MLKHTFDRRQRLDVYLSGMETKKPRPAPNRTTVSLGAWVPPEVKALARRDAARHHLGLSEYVAALIRGERPDGRPGTQGTALALAAHRIVTTLDAIRQNPGSARERLASAQTVADLEAMRRDLVAGLISLRARDYDEPLDRAARPDDWSAE